MDSEGWKIIAHVAVVAYICNLLKYGFSSGFSESFCNAFQICGIIYIVAWVSRDEKKKREMVSENERRSVNRKDGTDPHLEDWPKVAGLPIEFLYEELVTATNNFKDKIGNGGSGSVFKGTLNGSTVAVKRIDQRKSHQFFEFTSELSTIAKVNHVNLVRLRGFCCHTEDKGTEVIKMYYIIYDFYHLGSLDEWIFPRIDGSGRKCLSWELRYKVAIDVARALAYLHNDCQPQIMHLDVKPENILLNDRLILNNMTSNDNLRAVLSDFGMSRLMKDDDGSIINTTIRGTKGYMAPELNSMKAITEKSDHYSYGKVLLDLFLGLRHVYFDVNGNRNILRTDISQQVWLDSYKYMKLKLKKKEITDLVDKRLEGSIDKGQASTLVNVALWCLKEDPMKRPDIEEVVYTLKVLASSWNFTDGGKVKEEQYYFSRIWETIRETFKIHYMKRNVKRILKLVKP